jgi:hypothetical protein
MNRSLPLKSDFDLIRLHQAPALVGLSRTAIRNFSRDGLKLYRRGRMTFLSRAELAEFIRRGTKPAPRAATPCS